MVDVIDSFEDGDIAEYSGDTGDFSTTTSSVYDGSVALTTSTSGVAISRTDVTIAPSETPFGCWHYPRIYQPNFSDVATQSGPVFGVQSAAGYSNMEGYAVVDRYASSNEVYYELWRFENGAFTDIADGPTVPEGEYYKIQVTEWTSAGDITIEIIDTNGDVEGTLSATDDTYGQGGIGFLSDNAGVDIYYDYYFKPTSLSPPSNLNVSDTTSEDELTLDWTEADGAAGYYVYRAESSGSTVSDYTQVADVTAPPYTDTGLEDGEQFYYRVSSHD